MRQFTTVSRLAATAQRAGNNSTPSRPASSAAVFFRTPAAISKAPPAIRFPLRELEDLCPQPRSRFRDWGNSARNLNPSAAFLNAFASNFSAFARKLRGLAANPPPPASIYNLLPQSNLYGIATKKRKMRKENPHPSCRTRSPIGWERDGVRGFLTINHQLQTIN